MQCVTHGIIIRAKSVGDDRLLTILTSDYGVVSAVARGANKPRGRLTSSTELFCYSKLVLFRYRDSTTVDSAEVEQSFFALRQDIVALSLASYIAELCCELAPPEEAAPEYLRLVLNTLHLLCRGKKPIWLLKPVFELRLMTMAGFMPDLTGCAVCGKFDEHTDKPMRFSAETGALYCQNCYNSEVHAEILPNGVLSAMRHIIYSPIEKLFSFSLPEDGLRFLTQICESYMLYHLQKQYRSLGFFYSVAEE
ncbi:MAG TPA: DNA repair protein RecO [Clostridia bacterium]|nr:DNA repair protein RecO [Clostridia bacterium]